MNKPNTKKPEEIGEIPGDEFVEYTLPEEGSDKAPNVKDSDLLLVVGVAAAALTLLVFFGVALFSSGFVDFPDLSDTERTPNIQSYYMDALAFRERRVGLALILRTFLTGFSFVVGLALCTMGGVFILRQVSSLTTISGRLGATGEDAPQTSADALREIGRSQVSFTAYSPGVVFLVGGVLVMTVTQYFAIPIRTVDVTLPVSVQWCQDATSGNIDLCSNASPIDTQETPLNETSDTDLSAYCIANPQHPLCEEGNNNE
ncbi:MAG: hypothetical protein AAFQ79_02410 [Pseudomonadota bacterium]